MPIPRFALIATLFAVACSASATVLLSTMNDNNGHTYLLLSRQNWTSAEAEAVANGGHLVTINDAAENDYIVHTFITFDHPNDPLWIGLTDAANEGTFVWASGEPVTYTRWEPREPNDDGSNEDYGAINWHFASLRGKDPTTWNDTPNGGTFNLGGTSDGPYFGIAEVPEPAVVWAIGLAIPVVGRRSRGGAGGRKCRTPVLALG